MYIRNDPSFFLTNKIGAPQGEELGLIKPLSDSSCNCSDNSFILEEIIDTGDLCYRCSHPGIKSIWEFLFSSSVGGRPCKSSRKILQENLERLVRPQVASPLTYR
ncbi:hypothetical protein Tco_0705584 [Tanacetum coccineum]|uniref:Uncharacterized protein n=1 Tax=Tanacetum coccineum TaxID=301880 RepID=A0ABQ4Y6J0_9ASTR